MADGSSSNQTYAYDPLNRLKSVTEKRNGSGADSFNQTFNYDRWGNRTFDTAATFNAPEPQFDTNQMATANRLYSPGENIYGACTSPSSTTRLMCYDLAGNMIRDKHVSNAGWMTYDAENKMVRHNAGNTLNDPSVYQYDADGRRKESYTDYNGTTRYIHGLGGELIYEYVSFDNWKEYAYRNGDLLVTASNQGDLKWLVKDHLGTPRIVLDKNGTKTRHDYLPFGEEIGNTVGGRSSGYGYSTPQSDNIKQQFTGYECDIETGLDFAQARYFGSSLGRFGSPDPYKIVAEVQYEPDEEKARAMLRRYLMTPQRWNRYTYAINNPLKYTDPTGEDIELTGTAGEQKIALERLKTVLGNERFALVKQTTRNGNIVLTIDPKNIQKFASIGDDNDNREFSSGMANILANSKTVEFKITEKFSYRDANGTIREASTGLGGFFRDGSNGGSTLNPSENATGNGNYQIFVHPDAGGIATTAAAGLWHLSGGKGSLESTNAIVDAHEFGHISEYWQPFVRSARELPPLPNSIVFENAVRSRGTSSLRRTKH